VLRVNWDLSGARMTLPDTTSNSYKLSTTSGLGVNQTGSDHCPTTNPNQNKQTKPKQSKAKQIKPNQIK